MIWVSLQPVVTEAHISYITKSQGVPNSERALGTQSDQTQSIIG